MKVRRIHLHRFRGFEDLQLQFPKETNIAVFIGENGSGKTSLLEGISMILRDSLYKNHRYDKVDWDNPLNVNNNHKAGRISIDIEAGRRTCNFSQALLANRARLITEESLVLKKGEELTDEERKDYYISQIKAALELNRHEKVIQYCLAVLEINLGFDAEVRSNLYFTIALAFQMLNQHLEGIKSLEKAISIQQNINDELDRDLLLLRSYFHLGISYIKLNDWDNGLISLKNSLAFRAKINQQDVDFQVSLVDTLLMIGQCYLQKGDYEQSIMYFNQGKEISPIEKLDVAYTGIGESCFAMKSYDSAIQAYTNALSIIEGGMNIHLTPFNLLYRRLASSYEAKGSIEQALYYKSKISNEDIGDINYEETFIPALFRDNSNDTKDFNAYIETWTPLVLHYDAQNKTIDSFKDALPIAFHIPMTTDFDLIADWFTEHENDENRKRLRIKADYRSAELETIRQVITQGLTVLNGVDNVHFSDLQTELEDTVKDGQVSSWLSIKKNGQTLNVTQLSDGEKRVLVLLIDITRRLITAAKNNKIEKVLEGEGVVLIDEIEQHLHPKWQRTILPTLQELFPNIQFIITTHSPQVLSYVPNGAAFTVENGQVYPQNTYGRNNEWILEAIMNDVPRPKEVQVKLDEYFDMIREGKIEASQELREQLELLIGADEPEFLKADILIRRKQKSLLANETNP